MFNVLLDKLPTKWKEYDIDTDFQTGIMISQCMADDELSDMEKLVYSVGLLFPGEHPDSQEECMEAIKWFMNEYNHDHSTKGKANDEPIMDFDMDQWRIYSAFLNQYNIDLNRTKMHWFVFMGLLSNLNECSFLHVMDIRNKKPSAEMSAKEKTALAERKRVFSIRAPKEKKQSPQDIKAVEEFLKYANINSSKTEPIPSQEPNA